MPEFLLIFIVLFHEKSPRSSQYKLLYLQHFITARSLYLSKDIPFSTPPIHDISVMVFERLTMLQNTYLEMKYPGMLNWLILRSFPFLCNHRKLKHFSSHVLLTEI
jgi:hypothetical protein